MNFAWAMSFSRRSTSPPVDTPSGTHDHYSIGFARRILRRRRQTGCVCVRCILLPPPWLTGRPPPPPPLSTGTYHPSTRTHGHIIYNVQCTQRSLFLIESTVVLFSSFSQSNNLSLSTYIFSLRIAITTIISVVSVCFNRRPAPSSTIHTLIAYRLCL